MKFIFLLVVLMALLSIFGSHNAGAYICPPVNRIEKVNDDTIRALHHLFKRKRHRTMIYLAIEGAVVITFGLAATSKDSHSEDYFAVGLGAIGIASTLIGSIPFGKRRYEKLIKDYKAGKVIPDYYKKKIKTKDFR